MHWKKNTRSGSHVFYTWCFYLINCAFSMSTSILVCSLSNFLLNERDDERVTHVLVPVQLFTLSKVFSVRLINGVKLQRSLIAHLCFAVGTQRRMRQSVQQPGFMATPCSKSSSINTPWCSYSSRCRIMVCWLYYYNYYYCHFTALCSGLPGWASTRRNIHPLTPIMIIDHSLSASSIYYDP